MNRYKNRRFIYVISSFVLFSVATTSFSNASRIRLLFVIDDFHSNRRGHDLSEECMASYQSILNGFEAGFKNQPGRFIHDILSGENLTPEAVEWYYKTHLNRPENKVRPDESLFFYYCGHGGLDREHGHFLAFGQGGNLARRSIRDYLLLHSPRAAFVFSDACSSYADIESAPSAAMTRNDALIDLFLKPIGVIDVTAASPGHVAWFSKAGGSFSRAFENILLMSKTDLDLNRDGVASWDEAMVFLREETKLSHELIKSGSAVGSLAYNAPFQIPYAYYTGGWPKYERWLYVNNTINEPVQFWIQYQTVSSKGVWVWQPSVPPEKRMISYDVPANDTIRLLKGGGDGHGVSARAARWTIIGKNTGKNYGTYEDYNIVPPDGYPMAKKNEWGSVNINLVPN